MLPFAPMRRQTMLRSLPLNPENPSRGVNPYREEYLDEHFPGVRENEYEKLEPKDE